MVAGYSVRRRGAQLVRSTVLADARACSCLRMAPSPKSSRAGAPALLGQVRSRARFVALLRDDQVDQLRAADAVFHDASSGVVVNEKTRQGGGSISFRRAPALLRAGLLDCLG